MAKRRALPSFSEAFGTALRAAREAQDLSQEELGFRSGAHRTFISEIERGIKVPTLSTVERLARALCVLPSSLVQHAEKLSGLQPEN